MTLTVPQASTVAGRSADTTVQYQDTGAVFAQLGERVAEFGTALETDRLDREMSRLQVDMTRDVGDLRLQVEGMGDPDAAGAAWDQGMSQLRETYMTGAGENGRPRVDPRNAENFGLAFDDLTNRHGLAIGGQLLAARQSQRSATFMEYERVAGVEAARTDPGTRDQIYLNFDAEADKMEAAGIWTAEQTQQSKTRFRETTQNTGAIEMVNADPAGFLDLHEQGAYDWLPPDRAAAYAAQAQGRIDQMTAAQLRQAEADRKERAAQIDKRLGDIGLIADDGRTAVDEDWLSNPEVQASPKFAEAQAAIALRNERSDLPFMNVSQLDALIAEEKVKPVGGKYQTERLKVLEARRDAAAKGYAKDPVAFAKASGLPVPALPTFDPAAPDAYVDAFASRVTFGRDLAHNYYMFDTFGAEAATLCTDAYPEDDQVKIIDNFVVYGLHSDFPGNNPRIGAGINQTHEFPVALSRWARGLPFIDIASPAAEGRQYANYLGGSYFNWTAEMLPMIDKHDNPKWPCFSRRRQTRTF